MNRRAGMWLRWNEWLEDPAGVQIPDRDSLQANACGPTYSYDSHTRLILESKDKMRRRGERRGIWAQAGVSGGGGGLTG